ncbi:gametocyte associated protein, putative (GAP) [Plasmodium malariae]|uniref:Gametocyte associated protein, putative (GAP) n=1 Tax=Plasmodium malariae TaxID=5858 RepID=A0A1A8WJ16_PLAMA|nr:gametocyte associated protein, putative (GAP) [Plasmodium malariae]
MDRLLDCLFRGFLDTLMWLTEKFYKPDGNETLSDNEMIEKIIRKQMYNEGITLSNRTVSNEVLRTKERHDEIRSLGTTSEVFRRLMKLYELENNLAKEIMKKVSTLNGRESISSILDQDRIKDKIERKLTTIQFTYDEDQINAVASRIIERITDLSRDENIL